ncbi:MAG: ATP-binding protein [Alistipes sp.]
MMIILLFLLLVSFALCVHFSLRNRKYAARIKYDNQIIAAIPVSSFVLNKNKTITRIIHTTPAAMYGFSPSDIVGKPLSFFCNDANSPFHQACNLLNTAFNRIMETKQTEFFRYKIGEADLEATVQILKDGDVLCVVRDISQDTQAVREMMQKKRNEITVALNAGGLTSWSYDVKSKIFDSAIDNEVIYDAMGYTTLLQRIAKEDRQMVRESFDKILNGSAKHCEFTVRSTTRKGAVIWANVHAVPDEYDEEGRVKIIIGSQKNITKEVEATNELIKLREQADESNRLKSAFISNMSHEIRTPLNAIVGFSRLLNATSDPVEIKEYIQIIEYNNNLLLNIINDILDLSRIESNRIEYTFAEVPIYEMLKGLTMSTSLKTKAGVEMILDDIAPDLQLISDNNRITQVLANFLNNAVKFTFKGSIHLGCTQEQNGDIRFYVRDTGIGISEENKSKIFDRFIKLNEFAQGTGLGLPICETITTHLGGQIGVDSVLGEGSTFWVKFPPSKQQ